MKVGVVLILLAIAVSIPVYPFDWHLFLHVSGVVIFVGNVIVTGVWMILADRNGDPNVMRFSVKSVAFADAVFTGPGVVLILLNGLAMAAERYGGWDGFHETSWIVSALVLFALSGVVWGVLLMPAQRKMMSMVAASGSGELPVEFRIEIRTWYIWGTVATVLPIASLVLMIFKPMLW